MPTRSNMRQNCAAQQLQQSRRYLSSISFKQVIMTLRFAQHGMNIAKENAGLVFDIQERGT